MRTPTSELPAPPNDGEFTDVPEYLQELIDVAAPKGVDLPPTTGAEHQATAEPVSAAPELATVTDLDAQTSWVTPAAGEWPSDGVGTSNNQGMDL